MAEQSYPFENQSTSESQYSNLFRLLADTGVAGSSTSADLRPYGDSTGMFVKVPTGTALVRGFLYVNDAPLTLTVTPAAGTQRVDSVILRLDPAANTITALVKAGTPGGGAPALTQTETGVYEVRLADVTVPAGSTTVAAGQVVDRRPYTSLPWGEWTNDTRPNNPTRGKAGYNQTTGAPEYWDGGAWRSFSTTTTDAGQLSSGTIGAARLPYGVVQAFRADRQVDAPVTDENINGDWNLVYQPGVYRTWQGNTNQNAPANTTLDGTLCVFGAGTAMSSRTQVFYTKDRTVVTRTAWNGSDWSEWIKFANNLDVATVDSKVGEDRARLTNLESSRSVNLANAARIAAGNTTVNNFTSNGSGAFSGFVDVTWPNMTVTSFVATVQSNDDRGVYTQVINQTNTSGRIRLVRPNNTPTGVNWIAVGN